MIRNCNTFSGLVLALAFSPTLSNAGIAVEEPSGFYSANAVNIWNKVLGDAHPTFTIVAPDGLSKITAQRDDQEGVVLDIDGKLGTLHTSIGDGVNSEILWSSDSDRFFVTTSNGGLNGDYHLFVFGRFNGKLAVRDLTALIYNKFGHPVKCSYPEVPNVSGIAWSGSSGHVIVAAEIINHSNCDSFGTFHAYEVDPAAMTVVRSFDQLDAKRRFGASLGEELRGAPDECVNNSKTCYVHSNHPELYK